jgi:hypothetical protein
MVVGLVNRLKARFEASAWWARVLYVYVSTRLFSAAIFLLLALVQGDNYWTKAHPTYFKFLNIWDARWFAKIYYLGYPSVLPTNPDGTLQQNAWAFLPGFPVTVRALAFTGINWEYLAPLVAVTLGAAFALVAYRLFLLKLGPRQSLWAVGLFLVSPAAPILQAGYSESLGLLLVALCLYFWLTDRYWLNVLSMVALAFTRPGISAFALAYAVVWLVHIIRARRGGQPMHNHETLKLLSLAAIAGFLNFAWPATAAIVTGRLDAYVATELTWRVGYPNNGGGLTPLAQWFSSAEYFIGGPLGQAIVVLAILATAALFALPSVRKLGLELCAWLASYFIFLFLFFFPQSSLVRILMPNFALFGAIAIISARWSNNFRFLLMGILILLQVVWVYFCWVYQAPDFSPP